VEDKKMRLLKNERARKFEKWRGEILHGPDEFLFRRPVTASPEDDTESLRRGCLRALAGPMTGLCGFRSSDSARKQSSNSASSLMSSSVAAAVVAVLGVRGPRVSSRVLGLAWWWW
jgi:hypothetical protein